MSKDIRSFFSVVSKKPTGSSNPVKGVKNPVLVIDSDNEDFIKSTPDKEPTKKIGKRKKIQVLSSDSEDEGRTAKKSSKEPKQKGKVLKSVSLDEVFGLKPVRQSKVEAPLPTAESSNTEVKPKEKSKKKKKKTPELGVHDDKDFEKTLLELDDDIFLNNLDVLDNTIDEAMQKDEVIHKDKLNAKEAKINEIKRKKGDDETGSKKRPRNPSEGTTPKKPKLEQTDSGIDPDQEVFEKRRYSAILYERYKNRGGPKHHGEKEIPEGKPNCLANLTFLRTGVLDSLESDEFENLVKGHGGRVVQSVSKKVNYVVVGDDPGPSKLDKARGLHIPEIDEDDLLDMILVRSGMKAKFSKTISDVSVESGIEVEIEPKKNRKSRSEKGSKEGSTEENKPKRENKADEVDKSALLNGKSSKPNLKKLTDSSSEPSLRMPKQEKTVAETSDTSKPNLSIGKLTDTMGINNEVSASENVPVPSQKGEDELAEILNSVKKAIPVITDVPLTPQEESKEKLNNTETQTAGGKGVPESALSWTEKYKPKDVKSIIGQQDPSSNLNRLRKWLMSWYRNQLPEVRKKIPRPSPWAKNDTGAYYKAALLSGPPGVGKTTTATLLANELGFDVVEFNASDTRSKKLLHEEVSQLLSTTTIAGFATGGQKTTTKKRVLLMDEVDGMAGNEDRGGIQELIGLIKNSSVPIICMCNDRNHQKMRSLVNYCFDLRFNKPRLEQIRGAMLSICFKEGIKITPNALSEIITGTGCDVRQTLNHLSMWSAADKNISVEMASMESKIAKKDTIMGPWEVVRAVFTESEQKTMSLSDKSRLFFFDYSLGPLFVQENYLSVQPNCKSKKEVMKRAALAADAISMGDLIDAKIRGSNNWALLESQAMFSSVLPGHYMSGNITKRINFPGWLGKNSSTSKHKRMLNELQMHTRTSTSGSKRAMKLDYLVHLRDAIVTPLKKYGTEGVHQAVEVMKAYNLLREDLNNLLELCQWKDMKNPFNDVEPKVKSAFTRAYNKEGPLLPFAPGTGVTKKKSANVDSEFLDEEETIDSDPDEKDDDITADALIKVKPKNDKNKESGGDGPKSKTKKDTVRAGSSKAKDSVKGKSRQKKDK